MFGLPFPSQQSAIAENSTFSVVVAKKFFSIHSQGKGLNPKKRLLTFICKYKDCIKY